MALIEAQKELEQFIEQFVFKYQRKSFLAQITKVFEKRYEFIFIDNMSESMFDKIYQSNAAKFIQNSLDKVDMEIYIAPSKNKRRRGNEKEEFI